MEAALVETESAAAWELKRLIKEIGTGLRMTCPSREEDVLSLAKIGRSVRDDQPPQDLCIRG